MLLGASVALVGREFGLPGRDFDPDALVGRDLGTSSTRIEPVAAAWVRCE